MKLPKDLEKKRDEGSKEHGGVNTYYSYEIGFESGVQAAYESEAVRGLVEALAEYAEIENYSGTKYLAIKALAKFKVLTGTMGEE